VLENVAKMGNEENYTPVNL